MVIRAGPRCPQPKRSVADVLGTPAEPVPTSEQECLHLNVFCPKALNGKEKVPVMIWIHGGSFLAGSNSDVSYAADEVCRDFHVAIVVINYRLGILGFYATEEIRKEARNEGTGYGNYGLLDCIAAIHWVHSNIAAFGGDPSRITIYGESAGAAAVHYLCLYSTVPVRGAIMQSGTAFRRPLGSISGLQPLTSRILKETGGEKISESEIAHLRSLDGDTLVDIASRFFDSNTIPGQEYLWEPMVDGDVARGLITEPPLAAATHGKWNPNIKSVIIGDCDDEGVLFTGMMGQKPWTRAKLLAYMERALPTHMKDWAKKAYGDMAGSTEESFQRMSWKDTFSAFAPDDDEEEFGDGDDDTGSDSKKNERQRDAVLWVIDCSPRMLENLDLPSPAEKKTKRANGAPHTDSASSSQSAPSMKDQQTPVSAALWHTAMLMKAKIVSSPNDVVGVLFINTSAANPAAWPPRDALSRSYQGVLEIADLDLPDAPRILKLEEMARKAEQDAHKFRDEFRWQNSKLEEVLWTIQDMFSRGSRRIFFVTNDDFSSMDSTQRSVAIKRAQDLHQQGIELSLFPFVKHGDKIFQWEFWKEFLHTFQEPEEEESKWEPPDVISQLAEFELELKRKDFAKRTAFRVDWTLGEGLTIAVAGYNMIVEQKRPNHVLVDRYHNKPVIVSTDWIDTDLEQSVLPAEGTLKYAYEYGGQRVVFSKDEIEKIRLFKDHPISEPDTGLTDEGAGIRTLGFKSSDAEGAYHWKNTIRHTLFLYPDEAEIKGSTALFASLLARLEERNMVAICSFVPRRNSPPRLVALVPQIEDDASGQQSGFQIHPLPFADDMRSLDKQSEREFPSEALDILQIAIKKIHIRKGYNPKAFKNPQLQKHYLMVETVALDRDPSNIEFQDITLPNLEAIDKVAGPPIREFNRRLREALNSLPSPEPELPTKGKTRKRAVDDEGEGEEEDGPKRKRVQKPPASSDEIEEAAKQGKLPKMSVASLTAYLKEKGLRGLPRKKDELLDMVQLELTKALIPVSEQVDWSGVVQLGGDQLSRASTPHIIVCTEAIWKSDGTFHTQATRKAWLAPENQSGRWHLKPFLARPGRDNWSNAAMVKNELWGLQGGQEHILVRYFSTSTIRSEGAHEKREIDCRRSLRDPSVFVAVPVLTLGYPPHSPVGYPTPSLLVIHRSWLNRHETNANPLPDHPSRLHPAHDWKMRERLKTVSVALVLCLNIGIDPPDIVKTSPCAKLEAWVDPFSMAPQKSLDTIGRNLQQQYEVWQPRARYKVSLDPSVEETKKVCVGLRRNAKDDRILFHYNGHGVPKPTQGGEIWVFNKTYTQYIPVSIYELQTWLGSPCIFVYDCSNAGNILVAFNRFAEQRDAEALRHLAASGGSQPSLPAGVTSGTPPGSSTNVAAGGPPPYVPFRDCIQLAACGPTEILPMNPDLPADIFTCCLTTPIEIALRWFVMQKSPLSNITPDMINKIPGKLNDRRTPLGELNWIFTAITDTIAWNVLPHDLFKRLFRQDLMVAALFRNYLLAERVMRSFKCTPMSYPALPPTHQHPLWQSWDLAADMVLSQLPGLLATEEAQPNSPILQIATAAPGIPTSVPAAINAAAEARGTQVPTSGAPSGLPPTPVTPTGVGPPPTTQSLPDPSAPPSVTYRHSAFFAEQLTAFEVWLAKGAISKRLPEQLPIVLQVLLSQVHRLRALMLLSRFLDLGPWSVNLALSVGIFPYVLKLLQSPAAELKPVLVFIWAKILAVDSSCQNELLKDNGFMYFVNILASSVNMPPVPNISEHRAMCCFILSVFCHEFRAGQQACLKANVLGAAVVHLTDQDPLLRQWAAVCIGKLWERLPDAKFAAIKDSVHEKLCAMLGDVVPEVRAAAMFAIGTFMGDVDRTEHVVNIEHNVSISVLAATADAGPLVRRELVVSLSKVVWLYSKKFVEAAFELLGEDEKRNLVDGGDDTTKAKRSQVPGGSQGVNGGFGRAGGSDSVLRQSGQISVYSCIWKVLLNLSVDPHPEVASYASRVVDFINLQLVTANLLDTSTSLEATRTTGSAPPMMSLNGSSSSNPANGTLANGVERVVTASPRTMPSSAGVLTNQNASANLSKPGLGNNIRRSASFAYSLRNITGLSSSQSSDNILVGPDGGRPATPKGTPTLPGVAGYIRPRFAHLGNRSSPNLVATANAVASLAASPDTEKYDDVPAMSTMSEDGRMSIASSSVFGGGDGLPLESVFYDWCCEYFAEPQMKVPEVDDPGSVRSNERLWRQQRNNRVLYESKLVHESSERTAILSNDGEQAKLLCFHQFEDHLIVANDKDTISVWDWKQSQRLNIFSNGNPIGSRPTSVRFINEEDVALLLVGSDEGVVRLYRNYESPEKIEIVSAWRALTDLFPTSRGTGLITDWQQVTGSLLVSGDVKFVRVWDAEKELCVQDFPTKSNSSVTSMTSDRVSGMLVVGGFTDGAVRIYDRRLSSRESLAMVLQQSHDSSSIVNVHLRPGSQELVAGSTSGEIRLWDLRQQNSLKAIPMFQQSEMVTMSVHNHAPIIACGSSTQLIKMTNLEGHILSMIRPYEGGALGSSRSVITALSLHPHRLVLASGSADGHVVTWRSEAERSESKLFRPFKRARSRSSPTEPSPELVPTSDARRRRTSVSHPYEAQVETLTRERADSSSSDAEDGAQTPSFLNLATFKLFDVYPRRQRVIMLTMQKKENQLKASGKIKELSKDALKGKRCRLYTYIRVDPQKLDHHSLQYALIIKAKGTFAEYSHLLNIYMHDRDPARALQLLEDVTYMDSRKKRTAEFSQHFLKALSSGLDQVALALLDKGIIRNYNAPIFATRDGNGQGDFRFPSYFLLAVGLGSESVVKAMMKRAYLNQSWLGLFPIHLAVAKERCSLVNVLLADGADVMAPLPFEMFQLHRALKSTLFESFPGGLASNRVPLLGRQWRAEHPVEVTLEWARSKDLYSVDIAAGTRNCNVLLQVLRYMNRRDLDKSQFCFLVQQDPVVTVTLLKAGATPNQRTPTGCNPLHLAARTGSVDLVMIYSEFLDINGRGENGWTPLHEAVSRKQEQAARLLVHLGALREIRNDSGESADDVARRRGLKESRLTDIFDTSLIAEEELRRLEALRSSIRNFRDTAPEVSSPVHTKERHKSPDVHSRTVTHGEGPLATILDLSLLKYRERDDLESTFKFWRDDKKVFDMENYWDFRLRKHYGGRYDHRENLVDWDYHMKLRDKASVISKAEFLSWRTKGIAFQVRESTYSKPNRSLASVEGIKQGGITVNKWGYFGDIVVGPFLAHGVETANKDLLKTQNGIHTNSSGDIALYNVRQMMEEFWAAGGAETLRNRVSIKFLPMDPSLTFERRKAKLTGKFDTVYLGTSMAHRLGDTFDLMTADGVALVESAT
ncbi:hypothetical protein HDU93_001887 [Gonapodya sp. JEL0774]|nr:hypothetical protein HDU93_001887 [Gonapodya sp. JEL0774]